MSDSTTSAVPTEEQVRDKIAAALWGELTDTPLPRCREIANEVMCDAALVGLLGRLRDAEARATDSRNAFNAGCETARDEVDALRTRLQELTEERKALRGKIEAMPNERLIGESFYVLARDAVLALLPLEEPEK